MTRSTLRRAGVPRARRYASLALASATYALVAVLTVRADIPGEVMLPAITTLCFLQILLILAFMGSRHALWAGVIIQGAALLVAVLATGAMAWLRAICFAGMVTILTSNWLTALKHPLDGYPE